MRWWRCGRWLPTVHVKVSWSRYLIRFIESAVSLPIITHCESARSRIRCPVIVRSFWWKLDENRLSGIGDIRNILFCFSRDICSTWKMVTKLCDNLYSCRTLVIEIEYLDHNPQENLRISWTFCRKLTTCVFHFTWRKGWTRNRNFEERNLHSRPLTGRKILWNCATICRRFRWYIELLTIKNSWPWNFSWMSRCTIFAIAPFDSKYTASYLMAIVMFALSILVCEIFANQKKYRLCTGKWRSRSKTKGLAPFH